MLLSLLAFALGVPQDPIDLQLAARCFQEAKWCAEEDGGKLWGRSLEGPMLFVHAPSRTAVANREPPGMGMTAQDGLWTGKLPADVITANTAFAWPAMSSGWRERPSGPASVVPATQQSSPTTIARL